VASGNESYTVGETFTVMQTVTNEVEISLGIHTFQLPKAEPKPTIKKKGIFEKIMDFIKKLINKNK